MADIDLATGLPVLPDDMFWLVWRHKGSDMMWNRYTTDGAWPQLSLCKKRAEKKWWHRRDFDDIETTPLLRLERLVGDEKMTLEAAILQEATRMADARSEMFKAREKSIKDQALNGRYPPKRLDQP